MDREERIQDLISRMTLEEKVAQLSYTAPAVERLGIPSYNWWNECLHGVARAGFATVFPQAIGLAAAFDEDLARRVAGAISDEARAKYNEAQKQGNHGQYYGLTFWTPNINIFRDPRWGRGQETYGEDPCLTGRIGVAFVRGLQGDDPERLKVAACAKHYAVHSGPEKLRHEFDAEVSPKDLFETYLPAFKLLVENGVEAVMGAYNRTLGEPCCGSFYLLKQILRDTWGFKGHVTSDCWAIYDFHAHHKVTGTPEESAALALKAGCDLNCGCTYPALVGAHKQGLVTEADIDQALTRLLRTRFKLGMFDPPGSDPYRGLDSGVIGSPAHRALAREAALKSIVLLKNAGNTLPLDGKAKNIVLFGPGAANIYALLGNYFGMSSQLVTILEGVAEKIKTRPGVGIEYRQGSLMYEPNHRAAAQDLPISLEGVDVVIACYGLDGSMEGEEGDAIASDANGDRDTIELPPWQLAYLRRLKHEGTKVVLVLSGGSAIAFPEDIADAILFVWYPGEQGGHAVADILFGDAVPSGKLPITFPASTSQLPPYEDYALAGRTYRYMTEEPLYPFGFGLSYTTFRFGPLTASDRKLAPGGKLTFWAELRNTGSRDAEEVAQIYVSRDARGPDEPRCSLRGFRRVAVPAGQGVDVEFTLPASAFETVTSTGESVLLPGEYTVTVAAAAPLPVSVERGAPPPVTVKVLVGAA